MADTSYSFFYDESGAIGDKISLKNALDRTQIRNYIGTFLGCRTDNINEFSEKLQTFKETYIKQFANSTNELKSKTILKNWNGTNGLSSLSEKSTNFYKDLFLLLTNKKYKYHCFSMAGVEMWVRSIFYDKCWFFSNSYIYSAFVYSLSKFLYTYNIYYLDESNLCNSLIQEINNVIMCMSSIPRKQESEIPALKNIVYILNSCPPTSSKTENKISFPYEYAFDTFRLWLNRDAHIKENRIKLYVDGQEDQTLIKCCHCCCDNLFDLVSSVNSEENIIIQACDWLSGLIGQFCRAVGKYKNIQEDIDQTYEEKIKFRYIEEGWLDIKKYTFDLYKTMHNFFINNQKHYYKIGTGYFSDSITILMTFLRYFDRFNSYEDYKAKPLSRIVEEINNEIVFEINMANNKI